MLFSIGENKKEKCGDKKNYLILTKKISLISEKGCFFKF